MKKIMKSFVAGLAAILAFTTGSFAQSGGGALSFDGYDDYVTLGNPESLKFSTLGAFSVEFWINPLTTVGGFRSIIDKSFWDFGVAYMHRNEGLGFSIFIKDGTLCLARPTYPLTDAYIFTTPLKDNVWTHVAFTYMTGAWNMYINGKPVGSEVSGIMYQNSATDWMIGQRNNNGATGVTDPAAMTLDELRIWKRALTESEISENMVCELDNNADGLVAYYRFNQGSDGADNAFTTYLLDMTGNGNTGTLLNFGLAAASSNWVGGKLNGPCNTYASRQ